MENSKQACAERILKAIDYGRLPGAEIEKRLWAMIDEALAGPAPSGSDSELAELCESLLWRLYEHGGITDPLSAGPGTGLASVRERVEQGVAKRRRRRRTAARTLTCMAAALILAFGIAAVNRPRPASGPAGEGPGAAASGPRFPFELVGHAIAEHMASGEQVLTTSDSEEYAGFLGFDPGLPETLCGTYTAVNYQAMVESSAITLSIPYGMEGGDAPGGAEQFNLSVTLPGSADAAFDLSDEDPYGSQMEIGGVKVYACKDFGGDYYLWSQDHTVYSLAMRESVPDQERILSAIIRRMQD